MSEMSITESPRPDIVEEAYALIEAAEQRGLTLGVFGGVASGARAAGAHAALKRDYKDIDLFAPPGTSRAVEGLFADRAYLQDAQFNAVHGHYRLIYNDADHGRQVDVFVGKFEMCHALPLAKRLDVHPLTLPPADLLLTKLQIVELTDKDQRDLLTLLLNHAVAAGDDEQINGAYVARLCAVNWGLWRTVTGNLDRLASAAAGYAVTEEDRALIGGRIADLLEAIESESKSARWKIRARVGEKAPWYQLPEEVED
jgi:hypothetical protein